MRIGIDISQLAYPNTGVSNYLENLVLNLAKANKHSFVLFFSSLRGGLPLSILEISNQPNVSIVRKKIPPTILHLMWNVAHKVPIEKFTGPVDLFITSDWTEPPSKTAKATVIYDLIVFKYPEETHNKTEFGFRKLRPSLNIVSIQKKKLDWVKKESDFIFCISESTKKDAHRILGIDNSKLKVIYPGLTL